MKNVMNTAATIALAIGAVAMAATSIYQRTTTSAADIRPPSRADIVLNWRDYVDARHQRGPAAPTVLVTEFSDFQCDACAKNARLMEEVLRSNPDIAHSYRHFPLVGLHEHAATAAKASECAAEQGRFWEMHDLLYAQQAQIGIRDWALFAKDADVSDIAAFSACMVAADVDARIAADAEAARRLGATGTPTILVNDVLLRGVPAREFLDSLVSTIRIRDGEGARSH